MLEGQADTGRPVAGKPIRLVVGQSDGRQVRLAAVRIVLVQAARGADRIRLNPVTPGR